MKKLVTMVIGLLFLVACERVDFVEFQGTEITQTKSSRVMVKSFAGYNSKSGTIYVQQGIVTGIKIESTDPAVDIVSAAWKVEGVNYEGTQVAHKFKSLGETIVSIAVKFSDGTKEDNQFIFNSVIDLSTTDPVKYFVTDNEDGSWTVLFLFSKERLKTVSDTIFYYDGLVTDWEKKIIPSEDKSYVINTNGQAERTSDIGKYIGVSLVLKERGLYNIALIYSETNWTDLSGSSFIKEENPGLAWFFFDNGIITPSGDNPTGEILPGAAGDNYFRFEQIGDNIGGKTVLYFKLDGSFTADAFVVQELDGGIYSEPKSLMPVSEEFPNWGKIEMPTVDLVGKVSGFRYGPDLKNPEKFSENMKKSFFFDEFFQKLRFSLLNI